MSNLGTTVRVDELSIGAKINRIFHERLPLKLAERKIDEKHLRREIKIVIQNIRGVRSGLFTPDMAFERIVKEQIEQMIAAPLAISDQVTSQLISAVRDSTNQMAHYPALREEIDRIVRHLSQNISKTGRLLFFNEIKNCWTTATQNPVVQIYARPCISYRVLRLIGDSTGGRI